ncbi:unnamed protein product [Darwinula stevensoni]|uniref:Par3/HAL N-terminal domain-containing protein n=1 Tax=Darwinula stevensoni TaxID=69355 RepID=A0A7R8XC69_9CRUS|nr:unnamed protein product [Darwinula stevensoni]CAG0885577.1 unnamed protein product [Darwinula stevensoni]
MTDLVDRTSGTDERRKKMKNTYTMDSEARSWNHEFAPAIAIGRIGTDTLVPIRLPRWQGRSIMRRFCGYGWRTMHGRGRRWDGISADDAPISDEGPPTLMRFHHGGGGGVMLMELVEKGRATVVGETLGRLMGRSQTYHVQRLHRTLGARAKDKPLDSWVLVHSLHSEGAGGILDPDDRLRDVTDDREEIRAVFDEEGGDGGGAPSLHAAGDGTSASTSPEIFQGVEHRFQPFDRKDIEITGGSPTKEGVHLQVRRGSEPALDLLSPPEPCPAPARRDEPGHAKRWSAAPVIDDDDGESPSGHVSGGSTLDVRDGRELGGIFLVGVTVAILAPPPTAETIIVARIDFTDGDGTGIEKCSNECSQRSCPSTRAPTGDASANLLFTFNSISGVLIASRNTSCALDPPSDRERPPTTSRNPPTHPHTPPPTSES